MSTKPYGMICPITRACELLEPRWTIPILTQLLAGSTRFNDLRRATGNISPALLSKRLKELETNGLVERVEDPATGSIDYIRTQMGIDLEPALDALAIWAQRHIEAEIAVAGMNLSSLMWKMRRIILTEELPQRRIIMRFRFDDDGLYDDTYWAVIQPGADTEICTAIPGFDVDLYIETNIRSFSVLLLGRTTLECEFDTGGIFLSGDALLARTMGRWLKPTPYVPEGGIAMLPEATAAEISEKSMA